MKKKVRIIAIILAVGVMTFAGFWFFGNHTEVKAGIYRIQNNTTYPEAYILVEDGKAQFFNIDLNALYKNCVVERYITYLEEYKEQKLSVSDKTQIEESIDLNAQFCESKFILDYSKENYNFVDNSTGLCNYNFGKITDTDYLSYNYDWKKGSITLTRDEAESIVFERE